jgi:glycine cleavage system aminomethyltransferase T
MSDANFETRLNTLEQQVQDILARLAAPNGNGPRHRDWRDSLGMFDQSPMMRQIDEEGRRIRQQDREQVANDHS